jgi:hexosaminidase
MRKGARLFSIVMLLMLLDGISSIAAQQSSTMDSLIPMPVSVEATGEIFILSAESNVYVQTEGDEASRIGQYLADSLKAIAGYETELLAAETPVSGGIYLTASDDDSLGEEGYELTITPELVTLAAYQPAGLFRGLQTILQLLPPAGDTTQWTMPTGTIRDYPRFEWRGAMLDVARHFFSVDDVKRYLDLMAYYKLNRFHMHLSDDQGWRIEIKSWPNLATHGGSTEVGGGEGGYYTQEDYAEIVAYAEARYITVVPEIDMPGHTNAALASYAELNCDGEARELYTGIEVGFSSLCTDADITYTFVDDVVREIAALTPSPYFHIGGDESQATDVLDYVDFVNRVQAIVHAHGKQVIGWEEIAQAELLPTSIVQHWNSSLAAMGVQQGAKVIMSPASRAYLDMKYDSSTPLGLSWAGFIDVETGYSWDPAEQVRGVSETDILGVEAPLWSETLETIDDIEYMAFPRLLGYAEMGWSPQESRDWEAYKTRLGAHGARLTAMGVDFYAAPEVAWE